MRAAPDRLLAYICNIAGSLAGIAAFAAASYLRTPPIVWFAVVGFAGIIFGALFARSTEPDVDFGSNIAGAMAGGFAEALALVVGFNYLLLVAVVFYLLSAWLRRPSGAVSLTV